MLWLSGAFLRVTRKGMTGVAHISTLICGYRNQESRIPASRWELSSTHIPHQTKISLAKSYPSIIKSLHSENHRATLASLISAHLSSNTVAKRGSYTYFKVGAFQHPHSPPNKDLSREVIPIHHQIPPLFCISRPMVLENHPWPHCALQHVLCSALLWGIRKKI